MSDQEVNNKRGKRGKYEERDRPPVFKTDKLIIDLEGVPSCGKSEFAKLLIRDLKGNGCKVVFIPNYDSIRNTPLTMALPAAREELISYLSDQNQRVKTMREDTIYIRECGTVSNDLYCKNHVDVYKIPNTLSLHIDRDVSKASASSTAKTSIPILIRENARYIEACDATIPYLFTDSDRVVLAILEIKKHVILNLTKEARDKWETTLWKMR